ncbi:MAG: 4-(cytidine 5'-diphospho)-2-C-methyl-D-erythritol kinase, partial [Planctomycetota bacterium]|nr:4-(cytidine 5'-diphospho)-2-C-methyl-D-erythritol kinase [Planctomycetota bacterium]
MSVRTIRLNAPAKINLCLKVGPLRPDGFHYVDTVMLTVSMTDTIMLRPARELRLTCRPDTLSSGP